MRIGIISDTHIPSMAATPPDEVKQAFEGVDMIFHAGHAFTAASIAVRTSAAVASGYSAITSPVSAGLMFFEIFLDDG